MTPFAKQPPWGSANGTQSVLSVCLAAAIAACLFVPGTSLQRGRLTGPRTCWKQEPTFGIPILCGSKHGHPNMATSVNTSRRRGHPWPCVSVGSATGHLNCDLIWGGREMRGSESLILKPPLLGLTSGRAWLPWFRLLGRTGHHGPAGMRCVLTVLRAARPKIEEPTDSGSGENVLPAPWTACSCCALTWLKRHGSSQGSL